MSFLLLDTIQFNHFNFKNKLWVIRLHKLNHWIKE